MTTKRMSAAERKIFTSKRVAGAGPNDRSRSVKLCEPALGTVDQRLSIIIERLGGGNGIPRTLRAAKPKPKAAITKRCTPAERKAFAPTARERGYGLKQQHGEPALGAVDERLSIILARLGKPERVVSMSPAERDEYERWLSDNGLENGFVTVLDKRGAA